MSGKQANVAKESETRSAATIVQALAADPMRHVWVGASAGTGKTKVLIDRVLRLMLPRAAETPGGGLLPATPPGRILCLTYTKTAAAEMSNRIYDRLARWSVMPDDALAAHLAELTGRAADVPTMAAARRLFAQVLDTPGGLKIMTIHSFCQSILKRFPIEAGLAPHFTLLDERIAGDMLTQCLHDLIAVVRRDNDSALARAFHHLSLRLDAAALSDLLQQVMTRRALLQKLLSQHGDRDTAERTAAAVYTRLGLSPHETAAPALAAYLAPHAADEENLRALVHAITDHGTEAGKSKALILAEWLAGDVETRRGLLPAYIDFFLTKEGTPRARLVTQNVAAALPAADDIARREAARLEELGRRLRAIRLAEGTAALVTVGADMLARYAAAKKARDALDFDDLILRAAALLSNRADAQWVLYKLDEGLDHILVDEAQDTSPTQWQVVAALADEFLDGAGARDGVVRTLFVVGDEKQSIFSFQGADPAAFHRMKTHFAQKVALMQESFAVDLHYSFRSTASVLGLVDEVFNRPDAKPGVVHDVEKPVVHLPFRQGHAGHVEFWPLIRPAEAPPREAWQPATAVTTAENAASMLALRIAETIRGWLDRGEMLASKGRAIRAGDVLILVQGRSEIMERLMRALKAANIPVAGADRMKLRQEIAVMDLLAAARFALQPRDDLTLAALLKSPLAGVDEETLFDLCHGRRGTLWARLHDLRPDLVAWLQPLVATAGRATPYEFFASLLTMPCPGDGVSGRRAFYGRLGRDVADALNEFLNGCLSFEQSHIPALEGFVDWFARNESDIKREQDAAHIDQVRIMTVHASKGLQAPIVFLPDTTKILHAHNRGRPRLLWPAEAAAEGDVPLWAPSRADETEAFSERYMPAAQRQDEEYRRLLYVALTRAEDRLYIAGYQGRKEISDTCWYRLVEPAFADAEALPDGTRVLMNAQTAPVRSETAKEAAAPARSPLPDWARQMAAAEAAPSKPLAPSRPDEEEPAVKSPLAGDDRARFARGNIMHRLLEALPGLPRAQWPAAMRRFLARPAFALSARQQEDFAAEITAVLEHPEFAPIFGPGSRAEVPLVGLAGASTVMAGQIDRLLVTEDAVLVVDYKTNRPPPQDAADVPPIYLRQMGAYLDLLSRIYPGRRVSGALLWTDGPRLMPLAPALLAPYRAAKG
jgi:ATP-dependent helicase/nuclease subunit A